MNPIMRIAVLIAAAWPICVSFAGADTIPAAMMQPDAYILDYPAANGHDNVSITYPGLVSHAVVSKDIAALSAATGWIVKSVKITDELPPVVGAKEKMTSAEFIAFDTVPPESKYLPLESVISAMRNYPHLALTYFLEPRFQSQFQGLHNYDDKYVNISLNAQGSTYTYNVLIRDSHFQKLNLPLYQTVGARVIEAQAPPAKRQHRLQPWKIVMVCLLAVGAGGLVYAITSRHA